MAEETDAAMSLPIQCVRHCRRAVRELAAGAPVSALAALMAAQREYGRYATVEGFSMLTIRRLIRCIRSVEDKVYPMIRIRKPKEDGRAGT